MGPSTVRATEVRMRCGLGIHRRAQLAHDLLMARPGDPLQIARELVCFKDPVLMQRNALFACGPDPSLFSPSQVLVAQNLRIIDELFFSHPGEGRSLDEIGQRSAIGRRGRYSSILMNCSMLHEREPR